MIESKNDTGRNLTKQAGIRFSIVRRSKEQSALRKCPVSAGVFLSAGLAGRPAARNTMKI